MSKVDVATRFWSKVDKRSEDECWNWQAALQNYGYGQFATGEMGGEQLAHRWAWKLTNGEIPEGYRVRHTCENPICCNPKHLYLVSKEDFISENRARGEQVAASKLTADKVLEIRERASKGEKQVKLAEEFKVSRNSINRIVNRLDWKHI